MARGGQSLGRGNVVLRKQDLPAYGDAEDKTLILVEDAPLRRTLELFAPEEDVPAQVFILLPWSIPVLVWAKMFVLARLSMLGPRLAWAMASFLKLDHKWGLGQKLVPGPVCDATRFWVGIVSWPRRDVARTRGGGGEGFGFDYAPGRPAHRLPHLGAVCIGDRFELGVQSCVDRGLLTNTTIGHDVKIDNLCQVGHNAKVGDRVRMSGMSGVAGSSVLEDDVVLAGAAVVIDHVTVHQGATIGMDSCVISDVPAGESGRDLLPARTDNSCDRSP